MNDNHCIKNLLKLISLLQKNSTSKRCLEEGCSRPLLGPNFNCLCYNTRPISIYTKNGSLFTSNNSSVFRIEKVKDNCVVLRILELRDGTYFSTNNYVTVNINCICVVRCFDDVIVQNL